MKLFGTRGAISGALPRPQAWIHLTYGKTRPAPNLFKDNSQTIAEGQMLQSNRLKGQVPDIPIQIFSSF